MSENTQLRFKLADDLTRMRYGQSMVVPRSDALEAWPPTGDCDTSFEGTFRALALMNAGHRPEISLTTIERITRDLDGSFAVHQDVFTGNFIVSRSIDRCPRCHGRGFFEEYPSPYMTAASSMADVDADIASCSSIEITRVRCNHTPT